MNMDTIKQISRYLEERNSLKSKGIKLAGDTLLLEEKIVDSIGMMELLLFIEENFDITVPEEEIGPENFGTLNNLVGYLDGKNQSQ